jgi:AAA domain/UvrD-like helicase C-terminal domain
VTPSPTGEQQAIIDAYRTDANLVIEAGAGTGKTSTLRMLAACNPRRRGLYVAYNKAIASDAKRSFPASVTCATAHSLAFRAVGRRFTHRLNGPRMPARQTAKELGITRPLPVPHAGLLAPQQVARLVMETVTRFCRSDAAHIEPWHVPKTPGLDDPASVAVLREALVPLARRAWDDLSDPDGRLRFTHDCYLKLWQLSGPTLAADYMLLDEAQDANPVVAAIVDRQQHAQRVLVGDRCQAIYGWRGAIDAMSRFQAHHRLCLSQSFRFGPAVAAEANKWLQLLDAPLRLRGFHRITSTVGPVPCPDAVLCRTNAEAVRQLLVAADAGRKAALVGGGTEIRRLAEAAISLRAGAGTDHPELFAFRTWGEVQEYVEQDASGSDLKVFVQLIDTYGAEVVIDIIDRLSPEKTAEVVVSTAHKAKGREWASVRIASDFPEPRRSHNGQPAQMPRADAMLAYVAVTRARQALDPQGLAWVDQWL